MEAVQTTQNIFNRALKNSDAIVAAGVIGQPPLAQAPDFQLNINTMGRLKTTEEFGAMVKLSEPICDCNLLSCSFLE